MPVKKDTLLVAFREDSIMKISRKTLTRMCQALGIDPLPDYVEVHSEISVWVQDSRCMICGRRQSLDRSTQACRCRDQPADQGLVMFQMAFVFGEVAPLVRLGQHTPDFRRQAGGMRQGLEHDVTVVGAIAEATQRIKRQRVRGVVSKVKATVEAQAALAGIGQPRQRRLTQAFQFARRRGVALELANLYQVVEPRRAHGPIPAQTGAAGRRCALQSFVRRRVCASTPRASGD